MKKLSHYAEIYKACLHTVFANLTAYRADFIMFSVINLVSSIVLPLVTLLIYNNGASFPNWTMWEVLVIQGVYTMSNYTAYAIFNGVIWVTMDRIREGNFETVLIKPVSPLFFLTASTFDPEAIISIGGGLAMLIVSLCHTGAPDALGWLSFAVLYLAGTAVLCGIFLVMAAITFKWVGNSRIPEIFDSIKAFGQYPFDIFPRVIRAVAAFVIPVAMIGFFPASALLGRSEPAAFIAVISCIIFMLFGIWLYNKMIKLYEGVGG